MSKTPINSILKCKSSVRQRTKLPNVSSFLILIPYSILRIAWMKSKQNMLFYRLSSGLAVCDMFVMMEYIPFGYHMYLATKGEESF